MSVTGSDGKKTVVSQSRVTVTDDGGVTVMKTQPDAVQVGGLSPGQATQAAEAGLKAAEEGMKAARAGLEAAREYMSGEEWKKAQAELDRAQKELSSARKLSAAQLAAVREQEEAVRKYMASDEWKEAQKQIQEAQAHLADPPGTGCPGESCRGRVDGSRRRDPSQGRRTYGADRGCRYAEEQYDRDPRIGQVAV